MRALVAGGGEAPRLVRDYPEPELRPGEAIIRVLRAGVDFTDVEVGKGYRTYDGPLGNAFVGQVVEVSAGNESWMGARVVGEINHGCGGPPCSAYTEDYCPHRCVLGIAAPTCPHQRHSRQAGGAFADCLALPVRKLHRVPDAVSDRAAIFVEPVAAAVEILEQVHLRPSQDVFVLGDGPLAFGVAQIVRWPGCTVTVFGDFPERLEQFEALSISTRPLSEAFDSRADVVVESTGEAWGAEWALRHTRPNGVVVLKTTIRERSALDLSSAVVDQISFIGSRSGPFPPVLRALAEGRLRVEDYVSRSFSLDDGIAALHAAAEKGSRKIEILVGS